MANIKYLSLSGLSGFLDNLKKLFATKTEVDEIIISHTHSYDDLRNKPFYEGTDYSSILSGNKLTVDFYSWGENVYGAAVTNAPKTFVQDVSYKVIWDGFEYTITSTFGGNNEAGNPITSLGAPYGNYSTYPFGIDSYKNASGINEFSIHTDSTDATHTIDILELGSSFVTLDERFIPDSIARTSDVEAEIDKKIANLINGAPSTLDTIGEIATAMEESADVVQALNDAIGTKANVSHTHAIADITDLQTLLTTINERIVLLENKKSSVYTTISLPASAWVGFVAPYSQVVSIPNVTANTRVDLEPTVAQIVEMQDNDIAFKAENDDGVVTVYSLNNKPDTDYTMQASLTEVAFI